MGDFAVKVEGLNKTFKLPHEKHTSLKGLFVNLFRVNRSFERQKVLKDISFEIKKGEFFGIVGRNGSGKSTLLKLLAGIYSPDQGGVQINGTLTPFIELGVGFNPELTGRENVFLNGALLGFSRKEMDAMYQEIVDFAEIEKFMDQKLKNYSSGMQVRLAFSIAIRAKSDILLIDEVLAVGDQDFQRKCYEYFFDLKNRKQTVVFVTHDMGAVRKFCNRCLLINDGKIKKIGEPDKVASDYESLNLRAAERRLAEKNQSAKPVYKQREGNKKAEIISVETYSPSNRKIQNTFTAQEKIGVRITFQGHVALPRPSVGFIFQDQQNTTIFAINNWLAKTPTKALGKGDKLVLETVVDNIFTDGKYTITCAIESEDFMTIYDRIEHISSFIIGGHNLPHATTHPPLAMNIEYSTRNNKSATVNESK